MSLNKPGLGKESGEDNIVGMNGEHSPFSEELSAYFLREREGGREGERTVLMLIVSSHILIKTRWKICGHCSG